MVKLYVGYDPREAAVYHVFCQSVIQNSTVPVTFQPLAESLLHFDGQQDGTNAFIYSRYLIPELEGFEGWAIFCDGDMIVDADIRELWDLRDESKAVQVVPHVYLTRHRRKYIGTPLENDNIDYPRKNWSSVILWNCGHPSNRILTRNVVAEAGGRFLHRFAWLNDDEIGELPKEWNHLVLEYPDDAANLYHYTLGAPGFEYYATKSHAHIWHEYLRSALNMEGEDQEEMVARAWR